jgi:hypothetical protein
VTRREQFATRLVRQLEKRGAKLTINAEGFLSADLNAINVDALAELGTPDAIAIGVLALTDEIKGLLAARQMTTH